MTDGNNGSPYRRSSHHRTGHFSPMHSTGASSGIFTEESINDNGLFPSDQSLWDNFETVACSVTDLYRNPSWNGFQRSAAAATQFYKDSVDSYRRGTDAGITIGRQILCKEILHWLQTANQSTHSPFVRRDELINFVLTRAMMTPAPNTSEANAGSATMTNTSDFGNSSPMQTQQHQDAPASASNEPLEIFQEALAMPPSSRQQSATNNVGLTAFFVEECRRHANGKRRRLSPEHHPYYFHSSDSSPDGNGNGNGGYFHARPSKRSRRL